MGKNHSVSNVNGHIHLLDLSEKFLLTKHSGINVDSSIVWTKAASFSAGDLRHLERGLL